MSTPKPVNPPAFPTFDEVEMWNENAATYIKHMVPQGGMQLRDYFAGQALCGLASKLAEVGFFVDPDGVRTGGRIANTAYTLADAMLTERGKP